MLKDAIPLDAIRRVLVIKLRHHGDVLLTSPVFSTLKNHIPHAEVDALVYRETAEMLTLHPAISHVHTIDRDWKSQGLFAQFGQERALLSRLRARVYDLVVHLTPHPRGAWIKRLVGAPYGVAPAVKGKGRFWNGSFSHFYATPKGKPRHTVELNLDALRRIGIYPGEDERRLVLVPGEQAQKDVDALLAHNGIDSKGFVHIHPTSRWLFKCWPEDKVSEFIANLQTAGYPIVMTAAPAETEVDVVRRILAPLAHPVVDLSGKLSLKELAALAGRAKVFVGVDSAPMHIAAAMGTPTVALFGPSGDLEWGPWMVPNRIIVSSHSCRPCGQDGCGGGKISECLTTLPVRRVLDAALELLQAS